MREFEVGGFARRTSVLLSQEIISDASRAEVSSALLAEFGFPHKVLADPTVESFIQVFSFHSLLSIENSSFLVILAPFVISILFRPFAKMFYTFNVLVFQRRVAESAIVHVSDLYLVVLALIYMLLHLRENESLLTARVLELTGILYRPDNIQKDRRNRHIFVFFRIAVRAAFSCF